MTTLDIAFLTDSIPRLQLQRVTSTFASPAVSSHTESFKAGPNSLLCLVSGRTSQTSSPEDSSHCSPLDLIHATEFNYHDNPSIALSSNTSPDILES